MTENIIFWKNVEPVFGRKKIKKKTFNGGLEKYLTRYSNWKNLNELVLKNSNYKFAKNQEYECSNLSNEDPIFKEIKNSEQSRYYVNLFFKLGFTPSKTEQPLRGMELQEKEAQKD